MKGSSATINAIIVSVALGMIAVSSPAVGDHHDRLEKLLVNYQRLGLPMPKKEDARLAICISEETRFRNGVEETDREEFPAITGPSWKANTRSPWCGADRALTCWTIDRFTEKNHDEIKAWLSNRASDHANHRLARFHPSRPFGSNAFIESDGKWCQPFWIDRYWMESSADMLIVAIQCHNYGWKDVSEPIYELASVQSPTDAEQSHLLAEYAWNFWCLRFRWYSDRRMIIARLTDLLATNPSLNSAARANIVEDMRRTITPVNSTFGSIEADIDALRSIDADDDLFYSSGSPPIFQRDTEFIDQTLDEELPWRRLKERGSDAIPALVRHIDDFRLTRSISRSNNYLWHVRIADLVALLLHQLAGTEFSYDLLESEGRGIALDRRHVEHWLKSEGRVGPKSLSEEQLDEFDSITPTESSPKSDEFQQAILKGDLALAQKLIDEDPKIVNSMSAAWKQQSNLSETALSVAVRIAKPSVIKFLLERGADPNLADSVDSLPILSVEDGEVAEVLLKHGARWDIRNTGWGRTPLRTAAGRGHADVVRALMRAGAPLDFESAAVLNWTDEMQRMLDSEPWLVKLPSQALQWAAFGGSKEAVEFLLDHGADINAGLASRGPWGGLTALSLAVSGGHYDVAETLLKRGASTDVEVLVGNGTDPMSSYVRERLDQKWQTLFEGRWADEHQNISQ